MRTPHRLSLGGGRNTGLGQASANSVYFQVATISLAPQRRQRGVTASRREVPLSWRPSSMYSVRRVRWAPQSGS